MQVYYGIIYLKTSYPYCSYFSSLVQIPTPNQAMKST